MKNQILTIETIKTLGTLLSKRQSIDRYECCDEVSIITQDDSEYKAAIKKRDKLDQQIKKHIQVFRKLTGNTFAKFSDVELKCCVIQYVSLYSTKLKASRADELFDLVALDSEECAILKESLTNGLLFQYFSKEEFKRSFSIEVRSPELFEKALFI